MTAAAKLLRHPSGAIFHKIRHFSVRSYFINQSILRDIEQAAKAGHLDAEAVLSTRRQMKLETEEAALRLSTLEEKGTT